MYGNMYGTQGEWKISIQEPAQNQNGDIIIEKPVLRITAGKNDKWVALLGNPNNKEVQENAKKIIAVNDLLDAANEAYMMLVTDRPIADSNEIRDKLFRAIRKATV